MPSEHEFVISDNESQPSSLSASDYLPDPDTVEYTPYKLGTETPISAKFDPTYESGAATTPLYIGSETTLLQAVACQFYGFLLILA